MAGQMNLANTIFGHRRQVIFRVELVIGGTDINVVHVEQNATVSLLSNRCKKFPLRHAGMRICQIARDIFNQNLSAECVLNRLHPFNNNCQGFFRVG